MKVLATNHGMHLRSDVFSIRRVFLFLALASLMMLVLAGTALATHPRQRVATPKREALVTAFEECRAQNATHAPPPISGNVDESCVPPHQTSDWLTTSPAGRGSGYVLYRVLPFDPTPGDQADVSIQVGITDVLCKGPNGGCVGAGPGFDYAGQLSLTSDIRITDHNNETSAGPGFDKTGTVEDVRMPPVPIPCVLTADSAAGGSCTVTTSINSVLPGVAQEGKRATWQLDRTEVYDGGPTGEGNIASGCGVDQCTLFMTGGLFIP